MNNISKFDIKKSIKSYFPYAFEDASPEEQTYNLKFKELTNYAQKYSKFEFSDSTIRYQSMLLYISLLCLGIYFLDLSDIVVLKQQLQVNNNFVILVSMLVGLINTMFLARFYIDYRNHWYPSLELGVIMRETNKMIHDSDKLSWLDKYYWYEISNDISNTYSYLTEYQAKLNDINVAEPKNISFNMFSLEKITRMGVDSKVLSEKSNYYQDLVSLLDSEKEKFISKAKEILKRKLSETVDEDEDPYAHFRFSGSFSDDLRKSFDETLLKWIEANNELISETLHNQSFSNFDKRGHLLEIISISRYMRKLSITLEVMLPVLFSVLSLSSLWIYLTDK